MNRFATAAFLLVAPGASFAGMKDGPCQSWEMDEPDPYCASFLSFLPQYDEGFDIEEAEGRYALDCSKAGGIEVAGLGRDEQLELIYEGQRISDAEMVYSYYGNNNPPVTFITSVMFNDFSAGIVLNGDNHGFYLVEDWENGRRFSQCLD